MSIDRRCAVCLLDRPENWFKLHSSDVILLDACSKCRRKVSNFESFMEQDIMRHPACWDGIELKDGTICPFCNQARPGKSFFSKKLEIWTPACVGCRRKYQSFERLEMERDRRPRSGKARG